MSGQDPATITHIGRVYFGNRFEVPEDVTVLVETRTPAEIEAKPTPEGKFQVLKFEILPDWEPMDDSAFKMFMYELKKQAGEEGIVYLFDSTGASRSAMLAIILLHDHMKMQIDECFESVENSYFEQNRHVHPKWKTAGIPRRARHRMFAEWKCQKCEWKTFISKHNYKLKGAQKRNRAARIAGSVRIGYLPYRGFAPSCRYPYIEHFQHVRSNNKETGDWPELHPGAIGPIHYDRLMPDGTLAKTMCFNLNNLVLAHSVFPEHLDEETGELNALFYETQLDLIGTAKVYAKHPRIKVRPANEGEKPLFYIWEKTRLNELQFRILVFTTLYAKMIQEVDRFKELKSLHSAGMNLYLLDYDSYDIWEEGLTLYEAMVDTSRPWGHSMILYGLLTKDCPWEDPDLEL